MPKSPIAYIEFPTHDVAPVKNFYSTLFHWTFEDFGPDYTAFHNASLEGGFNAEPESRTKAPLIVLQTDDLDTMQENVKAAGGTITVPIFPFPGGRRFHFTDPAGNELAVMQPS